MGCGCIKFIFGLIGYVILGIGVVAVYLAIGPQLNTETRLLGGASITQELIAQQVFGGSFDEANRPDLPLNLDGAHITTNSVNAAPEIDRQALSDISSVDSQESQASQEVNQNQVEAASQIQTFSVQSIEDQNTAQMALQQNEVINKDTDVELIPLDVASSNVSTINGQGGAGTAGTVEQRLVELEWPDSFRVSGSGSVRLTLKTLPSGEIEVVPEIEDNAILATPILLTDYYDTHDANFTARLVAPNFDVEAVTPSTQILGRGQEGTWRWSLDSPDNSGDFVMTLGLDVTWVPKPNSGASQINPRPIWGQAVQVEVNYVFGSITVPQASLGGTVIAALGFIMQIPLLGEVLEFLWKLVFGREKKDNKKQRRRR